MMKSFFKKLAFVMALAMVVTLAAPAAKTAVAAEDKALAIGYQGGAAITALNLKNIGDEEDLCFYYAPTNWKELGWKWTSSNENVVSVDEVSGMVKAVADGTATVSVAVGTETAKVDVYVGTEMKNFEATIGSQDGTERSMSKYTMKVDEEFDFRFFGIYDYDVTRYECVWLSLVPDVATVDESGLVKAVAPGTAAITLSVSNQVVGKTYVVAPVVITVEAEEPVVVVEPSIKAVQKTQNKFEILFSELTAANYDEDDIKVVCVYDASKDTNGNGVIDSEEDEGADTFFIRPVSVDKDNNKLVVDTYADFVDGNVYEVTVAGKYTHRFTASVGKVARVELEAEDGLIPSNGVAATPAKLSVTLYDANDINVTTVETDGIKNYDRVTYEIEGGDTDTYQLNGNQVTFIEEDSVVAQAFYDYYNEDGRCDSNKVTVSGKLHEDFVAKVVAWAVVNEATPNVKVNWDKLPELWVAAGDQNRHIVALLVDSRGNYFTTHPQGETKYKGKAVLAMDYVPEEVGASFVFAANGYYVEFETTDPDNLLMYADGEVVTYKKVVSSIRLNLLNIYNDETKPLATVPLNVKPERKITTLSTSATTVTGVTDTMYDAFDGDTAAAGDLTNAVLSTNAEFKKFTRPSVKLTLKDQYGEKWWNAADCGEYEVDFVVGANGKFTDDEIEDLEDYAEALEAELNADPSNAKSVEFNTKYIRQVLIDDDATDDNRSNRSAVSFRFTDGNSERFVTVQIKLEVPNYEDEYNETSEIKVDTKEVAVDRQKVTLLVNKLEAQKTIDERAWDDNNDRLSDWDREAYINLYTTSKGYEVGYSQERLFVAKTTADKLKVSSASGSAFYYDDGTGEREIEVGDQFLIVVGPNGKTVPFNSFYSYVTDTEIASSSALGIKVYEKAVDTDKAASGSALYYTYALEVADDHDGDTIMEYLKTGRYTVQVRTVSAINASTGKISLVTASAENTAASQTITVSNTNAKIVLAGQVTRDLTETADYIEEVVADAFNFNYVDSDSNFDWLASLGNNRDTLESLIYSVDYRVGNGYVYIKSVTFKVPVDVEGELDGVDKYYLYEVAIGSSVKISNDVFFYDDDAVNN